MKFFKKHQQFLEIEEEKLVCDVNEKIIENQFKIFLFFVHP